MMGIYTFFINTAKVTHRCCCEDDY